MKAIEFFILTIFMSFASELYAQTSFMLWGYSDNPKSTVSFTFILRSDGMMHGIVFTGGFNIESFTVSSNNPLLFKSVNNQNKTIKVSSELKSADLNFPDGSSIRYKLANPPYALIQSLQNSTNGNTTNGGSCIGSKQCSMCNGKGWVAGNKTPVYSGSNSYYCSECGRNVPASHSHDRCPSCNGAGTTPTIR